MNAKVTNSLLRNKNQVSTLATSPERDDSMLVSRALDGDVFAKNAIFRHHAPYLLDLATRLTRSRSDGDDVLQETFLIAFRELGKLKKPESLRPWLTRILISQIRRSFRVKKLRAFFGLKLGSEDATLELLAVHDARPDLRVELKEIDAVLQSTPSEWRTTWMLHRVEGMSIHETARTVKRGVTTVKRYVSSVDVAIQSKRGGDQ
jgi:RNA polymerase sigma-70 factor (ECF subfamily)